MVEDFRKMSSKMASIVRGGSIKEFAALFTKGKKTSNTNMKAERAIIQPQENTALSRTASNPLQYDWNSIYLAVIQEHSGEKANVIDPRYGNLACGNCREMRSVAHYLGKDKDKRFSNFCPVGPSAIERHKEWLKSDYYKKYSMCRECRQSRWSDDRACAKCELCMYRWTGRWTGTYHDSQTSGAWCKLEAHPQCALAHYEKIYGPCTKWYIRREQCCTGLKTDGTFTVIDECLCGKKISSMEVIRDLAFAFKDDEEIPGAVKTTYSK